jgi:hypothetical protein
MDRFEDGSPPFAYRLGTRIQTRADTSRLMQIHNEGFKAGQLGIQLGHEIEFAEPSAIVRTIAMSTRTTRGRWTTREKDGRRH